MILIPLSGGVDSAAVLWHCRGEPIVSFHLSLGRHNPEAVGAAELQASRRQIHYLRERHASIDHVECPLSPLDPVRHLHPAIVTAIYTGAFLRRYPDVSRVGKGYIAVDALNPAAEEVSPIVQTMVPALAKRSDWEWYVPFKNSKKKEVIATLPPDLMAMTLSCDFPILNGSEWVQCGECRKCEELRGDD